MCFIFMLYRYVVYNIIRLCLRGILNYYYWGLNLSVWVQKMRENLLKVLNLNFDILKFKL